MTQTILPQPIVNIADHHEADHQKIQAVLTLEQIMTPRSAFLCCAATDRISEAFSHVPEVYDAVPVVDGNPKSMDAEIVGVIWRRDLDRVKPLARADSYLDERPVEIPLRASMPMLDYARIASADRVSFISDGASIVGLVTVYDLERLPVRLCLFEHLLYFEQRLGEAIVSLAPDADTWPDMAPRKRDEIQQGTSKAIQRDHLGSPILGIGFTEKVEIARHLLPKVLGAGFKMRLLDFVAPFRIDVAHGLPFKKVEDVPTLIRQIDDLITHLGDPRIASKH
jgi:CBS domain-containing protein